MQAAELQELAFRMVAVGALLVWAISFALSEIPRRVRGVVLIFCLSVVGFAFNEYNLARSLIGPLNGPLWLLSVAAVGWFWLFVVVLFQESDVDAQSLLPAALLTATGLLGMFGPETSKVAIWILHHILEIVISGHAGWVVVRSWRDDLVDSRRQLRGAVIVAMVLFVVGLALVQVRMMLSPGAPIYRGTIAANFAAIVIVGAATFLRPRDQLFTTAKPIRRTYGPAPGVDAVALSRLEALMDTEEIWRREGLTIGELALAVGIPEHRLRALINSNLGYRNFASFLNDRRIEQAMVELSNPANARQTVAALAYDLGYGSLGPFNRAFREAKGTTPTEWRRQALAEN
jgi:AraC-like DNA-binding protein